MEYVLLPVDRYYILTLNTQHVLIIIMRVLLGDAVSLIDPKSHLASVVGRVIVSFNVRSILLRGRDLVLIPEHKLRKFHFIPLENTYSLTGMIMNV